MAGKIPPEPKYKPAPELVIMTSRAQQLHKPLKLTTLISINEPQVYNALGIQTLCIPRGFPTSIILKKLTLEFHGYANNSSIHYSIDVISSLPRGVVDGLTSTAQSLERLNQLYDPGDTNLIGGNSWYANDNNALQFVALTAPVQRGVKLLARMNGRFVDGNEYRSETIDFEELQKNAGNGSQGQSAPTGSGAGAAVNPAPPQIVTVDDEFVVVVRVLRLCALGLGRVTGVIGLEVS
ncbi:uncharacterized protein DFL_005133 [Arthrobotrys flagrans]|uniref:Uncharacterized protein n=1 Tax=Arthrobotrys flagrans TaxID=97331 RepID=A0A437A7E0_ARTFL|nr:hypothetical protein DFL_005133 [Arthrobotrys flagrans]